MQVSLHIRDFLLLHKAHWVYPSNFLQHSNLVLVLLEYAFNVREPSDSNGQFLQRVVKHDLLVVIVGGDLQLLDDCFSIRGTFLDEIRHNQELIGVSGDRELVEEIIQPPYVHEIDFVLIAILRPKLLKLDHGNPAHRQVVHFGHPHESIDDNGYE